ncbi:Gfo/Idh/MocA family oxidoreductase [candidate division KSB1 bacterium]|nr:Gfo/Idh/MocA family oxidoreductase [candidate division KSB1 bacterium]
MATINIPIIIHGITGRMGQTALEATQKIAEDNLLRIDDDLIHPVPIGVARNLDKLKVLAHYKGLTHYFTNLPEALELAQAINPKIKVYHNTIATGIRKEVLLPALRMLDAETTAIFQEKPVAANYADGYAIVEALENRKFFHGVVHHMLEAPGVQKALELIPEIKPLTAQMVFGYEVAPGLSDKFDYCCQRPDFNWELASAGGGIILDMCHEGYLSEALFGESERISAVARLLVPQRLTTDRTKIIHCDVEDFAALRREHTNGIVNTSVWSWYRRINSEFGPLEITIEGEKGTLVFGLYGLKVQWHETAPVLLWERGPANAKIKWRDYWEYPKILARDPFAVELADFIRHFLAGKPYWKNATHALDLLGQVEAFYASAANNGRLVEKSEFLTYPAAVPSGWQPERLQSTLRGVDHD